MLISEEYRDLNSQLHETNAGYGTSSGRWTEAVLELAKSVNTIDVLDYGCGKGVLQRSMPTINVFNYDPAIPGWDEDPEPRDLVVCTDVMEHVEPEMIDDVLAHIAEKTKITCFFNIATRPAVKTLADGRNAHLTVEPAEWWFPKLSKHFEILTMNVIPGQDLTIVAHKRGAAMKVGKKERVAT